MNEVGLNSEVIAGGRKFHVQTTFLEPVEKIVSNIFDDGKVIMKKSFILLLAVLLVSLLVVGGCFPTGDGETDGGGFDWTLIVFLVLIVAIFYFLMIRPQLKRQKEHRQLMEQLQKGDKVVTAGGIWGVIESLSEDSVLIKVESGATMRVAKSSVAIKRDEGM